MHIIIVSRDSLRGFAHPALDLTTGQLIELDPMPFQLELPLTTTRRGEMVHPPTGGIDAESERR